MKKEEKYLSWEECCKQVAIKHKIGTSLVTGHRAGYFKEAAELFASQFKPINSYMELLAWVERESIFIEDKTDSHYISIYKLKNKILSLPSVSKEKDAGIGFCNECKYEIRHHHYDYCSQYGK